jgi:hypothetical protein
LNCPNGARAFFGVSCRPLESYELRISHRLGFTNFIIREVTDQLMFLSDAGKTTLDHSMRFLLQLLQQWKHVVINSTTKVSPRFRTLSSDRLLCLAECGSGEQQRQNESIAANGHGNIGHG